MKVYVLTIEHKHGNDVSVYATEEAMRNGLHDYVTDWWEEELKDWTDEAHEAPPIPDDRDKAIEAYFRLVEREHYSWDACEVIE